MKLDDLIEKLLEYALIFTVSFVAYLNKKSGYIIFCNFTDKDFFNFRKYAKNHTENEMQIYSDKYYYERECNESEKKKHSRIYFCYIYTAWNHDCFL